MIHPTPEIHIEARNLLNNGEWDSEPLRTRFSEYETVFVSLHPFLRIKESSIGVLEFTPATWPSRLEIEEHCEVLYWDEVIRDSKFIDISELDRGLAAYHTARMWSLDGEHDKLNKYLNQHSDTVVPAQVDFLPEIQEKKILDGLASIGIEEVFVYSDTEPKPLETTAITHWNTGFTNFPAQVRIESDDIRFFLSVDFDQRYTYLVGTKRDVDRIVKAANLEGFYCDDETPCFWSYTGRPKEKKIEGGLQKAVNWLRRKTTHNTRS